eukprot:TRINITY_DN2401_c0_g1_i1.p1 TRINITY_DN2401_c0_g1~~TRINITY_DN2401_c0_g1_i1.p1  ORF type:complete len:961 (+),score=246.65 TRINITY_DN2401_c0_g1_i1:926-3808(+)
MSSSDGVNHAQIRKVVQELLQSRVASNSANSALTRRFITYLRSDALVDAAYIACIERCKADPSPDIAMSACALIRFYLTSYPPSVHGVYALLVWAREQLGADGSNAVQRSFQLLENALLTHVDTSLPNLSAADQSAWVKLCRSDKTLTQTATPLLPYAAATPRGGCRRHRRSVQDVLDPALSSLKNYNLYAYGTAELASLKGTHWKPLTPSAPAATPRPTATHEFSNTAAAAAVAASTPRAGQSMIGSGTASKARPLGGLLSRSGKASLTASGDAWSPTLYAGSAPLIGGPRRSQPSAAQQAFKPLTQRKVLDVSQEQLEAVISTISSVPSDIPGLGASHEDVEFCQKLLVKFLCDSYGKCIKDGGEAEHLRVSTLIALSMLKKLIASPYICVRTAAFDVVYNCAVHATWIDGRGVHEPRERGQSRGSSVPNALLVHREVRWLVQELVLHLVQWDEEEDPVWAAGMTCWLVIVTDPATGFPTHDAIHDVDIRALKRFTELEMVHTNYACTDQFVRMIFTSLMGTAESAPKLNSERLAKFGGWRALADLYLSVHSWDARQMCFTVLYHHIAEQMIAQGDLRWIVPPDQEKQALDNVLSELIKSDLHWFLPRLLLYPPSDFQQTLLTFLTAEGAMREGYTRGVVAQVLHHLHGVAVEYGKLPKVIRDDTRMLISTGVGHEISLKQLRLLSTSNSDCHVANIENRTLCSRWLFALIKPCVEGGVALEPLKTEVESILNDLTKARIYQLRLLYLRVTNSYLLLLSNRDPDCNVVEFMCTHLKALVNEGETHPQVLYLMFNIIAQCISHLSNDSIHIKQGEDGLADMLLSGALEVPNTLLLEVKPELLLFMYRSTLAHAGPKYPTMCTICHCFLLLIIAQVNHDKSRLPEYGGKQFFIGILDYAPSPATKPLVATAAAFLCNLIASTEPNLWRCAVATLPHGAPVGQHPHLLISHVLDFANPKPK